MEGNGKLTYQIHLMCELRTWERKHLPISRTNAGYHLFLFLSHSVLSDEGARLKNIYHSLPFSEKTLRLLLRELESDGWIQMPNKSNDPRYKEIIPTAKFNNVLKSWSTQIDSLFV